MAQKQVIPPLLGYKIWNIHGWQYNNQPYPHIFPLPQVSHLDIWKIYGDYIKTSHVVSHILLVDLQLDLPYH